MEPEARIRFPDDSRWGTSVVMERLKARWTEEEVKKLGRDLWMLQSPFRGYGRNAAGRPDATSFEIDFETTLPGLDQTFGSQVQAAIEGDDATITGRCYRQNGKLKSHVTVSFRGGDSHSAEFEDENAFVSHAKWQIRVYNLRGRQASGLPVETVRDYFKNFGVMMIDAGFRLPFYGAQNDWLGIEYAHSHRMKTSALLPASMRVERALNDLPSQGRLLGVVAIDTGAEERDATPEQRESGEYLKILVTRDRLVANKAYAQLSTVVRRSLDFYATRQRIRVAREQEIRRPDQSPAVRLRLLDSLIEEAVDKFPYDETIAAIRQEAATLQDSIDLQLAADDQARSLLGPLASAGMAALAMEHENAKEVRVARSHVRTLKRLAGEIEDERIATVATELEAWLHRFDASRQLFSPLMNQEDRASIEPMSARSVLEETVRGVGPLVPSLSFEIDVAKDVTLPSATFAEWYALFQNVLLNASNAMVDVPRPRVAVIGERQGRSSSIRISDVGSGINLETANRLFEPFEREQTASEERRQLGLAGMGLGLTIVRMIADQRGCNVGFVHPEPGYSTTFEISWRL
jgi:signal transduction histidine kinase